MTIDEAKYELDYCIRDMIEQKTRDEDKALDIAIKSLEAWEKVRQEVKQEIESNWGFERIGEENILAIIDKHLQEVDNAGTSRGQNNNT